MGQEVTAAADLFSLGIVLWEMLAGRRLFLGETDYQTIKLVQQANIPSLPRLNPEVDADFDRIVSQSLARDPRDRFRSARELGDALAGYLFGKQMKVTSYDIANLLKSTLGDESKERERPDQSMIDRLIQEELLRFTSLEDLGDPLNPKGGDILSPDILEGAIP